jgi:hypothetical protein
MQCERKAANVFLLAVLLLICPACHKTPDEEQIRLIIREIFNAVEEKSPVKIATYLHPDFRANGEMNAQQVKQLLVMTGMQHQSITMTMVSSKTIIDPVYPDRAETVLSVVVTGSSGSILPSDGSVRVVKLQWRKDDDWKILKADWQE